MVCLPYTECWDWSLPGTIMVIVIIIALAVGLPNRKS